MKQLLPSTNYTDSWQLTKESFQFLSQQNDLNLLPLLKLFSLLGFILIAIHLFPDRNAFFTLKPYLILIPSYFLFALILVFLQAAFTAIALNRLKMEPASLFYGLKSAARAFPTIAAWAMIVSTIGMLTKLLEGPQKLTEKLLGNAPGFSWSMSSYFVLPILIAENIGPIQAMRRSLAIVGHGWKSTVSVKALVVIVSIFVLLIVSEFAFYPEQIIAMAIWLAPFFLVLYIVGTSLETIIVCALYINVVQQTEPKYFDNSILGRAFIKEED